MPYVYAHAYCGERTLALCGRDVRKALQAHVGQFFLGVQGPDPWFFHNASPFMREPSFADFGGRLHVENVDGTFAAMLGEVESGDTDRRFAYFAGYLCHYALDCTTHPYVYYRTEEPRFHTPFEAAIDIALLRERSETLRSRPLRSLLPFADTDPFAALHTAAARAMDVDLPKGVAEEPPAHMRKLLPVLSDPFGFKHPLFKILEIIIGRPDVVTGKLFYPGVGQGIDALNSAHAPWQAPWGEEIRNESFGELLESAAQKAAAYASRAYNAIYANASRAEALNFLGALSYDTGLNWRRDAPMLHTDCAFRTKQSRAHAQQL